MDNNRSSLSDRTTGDQRTELLRALEMARDERSWLYDLVESQTCSDLCDKTWEQQGCPSGTCARATGLATFRIVTHAINAAIARATGAP